ncbi:MAG: bifunctional oligoribonuclease/PAP phosphatase NrnA [Cyanobacteria bacterium SIG30]|nr:bifunctional oligoribonuclease/PAP phosphatase NrnA [Cyanobacteria bacterium SIG30]
MIKQIQEQINNAKKILIISHINPDGDTLGSMCALKLAIGNKADMLIQTIPYPKTYSFLPKIDEAKNFDNVQDIYDLVITVDVAAADRIIRNGRKIFDNAPSTINFDHHKTNPNFAKYNLVDANVSSCGEVLFNYFKATNTPITKEIATCLYVAILTDTGCFRYENAKPATFDAAKELIATGIDNADIAKKCYDSKAKEMVLLHSYCVSNAKFELGDKIAYVGITNNLMKKFNAKNEHTEGICETLRSIDSVQIAFVAKETGHLATKISLRSKVFDLTKITNRFSGGGHKNSAGCTINLPINRAIEEMLAEIKKYEEEF